jgi:hypothetical protein
MNLPIAHLIIYIINKTHRFYSMELFFCFTGTLTPPFHHFNWNETLSSIYAKN